MTTATIESIDGTWTSARIYLSPSLDILADIEQRPLAGVVLIDDRLAFFDRPVGLWLDEQSDREAAIKDIEAAVALARLAAS